MAKALLTPKDLADAIGVSESSMRRWIDSGRLKMTRTAGGHRRIELVEAVRFVRESGIPLVHGAVLGLGEIVTTQTTRTSDQQQLYDALSAGDRTLARGLMLSWHLSGRTLAAIFDGPLRAALERLGELWLKDGDGVLVEHRATDICIEAIHSLRSLLPLPPADAPLAIGATPGDEWHSLPSQMAAAVAREGGFRDVNYGASVPVDLLMSEALKQNARIVWLSVTMSPKRTLRGETHHAADELATKGIDLVVGGRHRDAISQHPRIHALGSMSEFAALIAGVRNSHRN